MASLHYIATENLSFPIAQNKKECSASRKFISDANGSSCKPELRFSLPADVVKVALSESNNKTVEIDGLSIRSDPFSRRIEAGQSELKEFLSEKETMETMQLQEMLVCFGIDITGSSLDELFLVLQNCKEKKDDNCARKAYFYACYLGLEGHVLLGKYIIPMFVDCGCISDAKQVLDRLSIQNEHSWTSLIQGCNESGESQQAFELFQRMQYNFVHPSRFTYVALLKACAKVKDMKRGREIHAEITKHTFEMDYHIGNILVDMYSKCGSLTEAYYTFRNLSFRDIVSWNTIIAGYVDHGYDEEAFELLEEMQNGGTPANRVTFIYGLKACGNGRALKRGQLIHSELAIEGYDTAFNVGSTLIDMYVKCGSLVEAQDVFDCLIDRDVIAWNTMIVGYAERGLGTEALCCLEDMKSQGISPDAVTLAYCIKACGSIGSIYRGHVIHMESVKGGHETDDLIGSTLVDMYVKFGSVEEAQEVFNKMPFRGVVPWTTLIAGYIDCGFGEEALNCLRTMELEGIPANDVTLVCGLKACSSIGDTEFGRYLHISIAKEGYEELPFIGAALVDMYAKCGSLPEAQESLLRLPDRGVVVWTALIAGYVKEGLGEEALGFLKQMQKEGVFPNAVTFSCCLKACTTLAAIEPGQELHSSLVIEGFEQESFIASILVDMYAKCGSVADAREVFDNLPSRDLVIWNSLITGYVEHDFPEEALNCFERMQVEGMIPNPVTFVLALKACGNLRAIKKGQEIIIRINKEGLHDDIFISNTVVDFYAKCGCLLDAQDSFDKLLIKDVVSWTSLIQGYTDYGFGEEALNYFIQMKSEGLHPDPGTFVCCLKACGSVGALERGQEIHLVVIVEGFENDFLVGNSLVDMYAKCGWLTEAQEIFDDLNMQDVVSWTALIGGYAESGHVTDALNCFHEMLVKGVSPDVISWNNVILGYSEQADCENVCKIYAQMQEQGLLPNKVTLTNSLKACGSTAALKFGRRLVTQIYGQSGIKIVEIILANAIVDMYGRCGNMNEARKAFDEISIKQLITWNGLLTGYSRQGESKSAFNVLEEMREEGIKPNEITFLAVLIACNHAGLVERGRMYFEMMKLEYGLERTIMHYNCMIDLFGRAGLLEEVVTLLHEMPFEPNDVTWITVLSACQKWSNVELGEHAFENLMKWDRSNTAAFVTMANIYANAHMWDEMKRIEAMSSQFQERTRISGKCLIEINGTMDDVMLKNATQSTWKQVSCSLTNRGCLPNFLSFLKNANKDEDECRLGVYAQKHPGAMTPSQMPEATEIRIANNRLVCNDCHTAIIELSRNENVTIIFRDAVCTHVLKNGKCSCMR